MKNKLVKLLGVLASIATILGLYITIFGVPKLFQPNRKYVFNKQEFINNTSSLLGNLRNGDTLRLEETLSFNWSGVSSCGDDARIKRIYQREFLGWSTATRSIVDSLRFLSSNFVAGKSSSIQRQEPWPDNSRSCTGTGSINCWTEFIKN